MNYRQRVDNVNLISNNNNDNNNNDNNNNDNNNNDNNNNVDGDDVRSVGFCGGKTGQPGENPRSRERTNNKLTPHETLSTGIEPVSRRWDASASPCSPEAHVSLRMFLLLLSYLIFIDSYFYGILIQINGGPTCNPQSCDHFRRHGD